MAELNKLEDVLNRKCQASKFKFYPFAPVDNSAAEINSSDALLSQNKQLLTELLEMTFIDYISHWIYNESFQKFVVSYLMFRSRPLDKIEDNIPNLFDLDKLIFREFLRLISDEYRILLTVEGMGSVDIKQVYSALLCKSYILCIANVVSLGCIMGDSNMEHFRVFVKGLYLMCPALLTEMSSVVREIEQSVHQVHEVLSGADKKLDSKSGPGKPISLTKTKGAVKTKAQSTVNWDTVLDMSEFLLDISYWMSIFMQGYAPLLHRDEAGLFFVAGSFVTGSGQCVIRILLHIYEQTIPVLDALASTQVVCATANETILSRIHSIVKVCRMRVVQSLFLACTIGCTSLEVAVVPEEIGHAAYTPCDDVSATSGSSTIAVDPASDSNDVGNAEEDALMLPWMDVVVSIVSGGSGLVGPGGKRMPAATGALLADVVLVYTNTMRAFLNALFAPEEPERRDYLLQAIFSAEGFFAAQFAKVTEPSKVHHSVFTADDVGARGASTANDSDVDPSIAMVQAIFPDYGAMFIAAVLKEFDNNPERVIDALLSDNIPPHLRSMDRTIKTAWMGKNSAPAAPTLTKTTSSGDRKFAVLEMTAAEKRAQKERIRLMNRQMEEDAQILQAEYGDDYDDQFDEAGLDNLPSVGKGKKAIAAPNWEEERKKVLRLNSLIRNEESEERFWAGLANTNTKGKQKKFVVEEEDDADGGGREDEDTENTENAESKSSIGDEKKSQGNVHGHGQGQNQGHGRGGQGRGQGKKNSDDRSSGGRSGAVGGGKGNGKKPEPSRGGGNKKEDNSKKDQAVFSEGNSSTGRSNKPRTKTFDRHHQKDKSTRKFGGFAP